MKSMLYKQVIQKNVKVSTRELKFRKWIMQQAKLFNERRVKAEEILNFGMAESSIWFYRNVVEMAAKK